MVNPPSIVWREWTYATDPSGFRVSQNAGELASVDYVGDLSTAAGKTLVFEPVNTSISGQVSESKLLTFYVKEWNDASGVSDMRVFLASVDDFDAGSYRFLYQFEPHFFNLKVAGLDENDDDLDTELPVGQNVYSTLGSGILANTGYTDDTQVSEYIIFAVYIGTDVPIGLKGGAGGNSFRYRLRYTFS